MAEQSKNISLWIDPELIQALDAIAQRDDRSRNWEIVQAIKAWVNSRRTEGNMDWSRKHGPMGCQVLR